MRVFASFRRSSRLPKITAPVGQTDVQPGCSPFAVFSWQSSHFTIFGLKPSHWKVGTWNGQATSQYRQPTHLLPFQLTTPVFSSFVSPWNMQAETQAGAAQCMHCCLM